MSTLTFLSYNIHNGKGLDNVRDLGRIADVILSARPDCVALQEVDVKTRRSDGMDELSVLANLTGMHGVFGSAMDYDGGQYGVAILSRRPVLESQTIPLPGPEPRVLLKTTVADDDGRRFQFCCTHLDLQQSARLISVGILARELSHASLPSLVMGDFNAEPGSPELDYLASVMIQTNPGAPLLTHPSDNPSIAIDHCFHSDDGHWSAAQSQVLDEPVASDHLPILARLTLDSPLTSKP